MVNDYSTRMIDLEPKLSISMRLKNIHYRQQDVSDKDDFGSMP
jgi:hypothetical protein